MSDTIKIQHNRTKVVSEITPDQWKQYLKRGWKDSFTILAQADIKKPDSKAQIIPKEIEGMRKMKAEKSQEENTN